MPKIEVTEQQIIESLRELSPAARREALRRLIQGGAYIDGLIERNRTRMDEICRRRGVDFAALSEEQKESLIDEILHEA
jgi:hypothetical protein